MSVSIGVVRSDALYPHTLTAPVKQQLPPTGVFKSCWCPNMFYFILNLKKTISPLFN